MKTAARRLPGILGLAALFFLGGFSKASATPPAGQVIGNQASATYTDATGVQRQATSNVALTTVQQVGAFVLLQDQSKYVAPGGQVVFVHTLINTGNGTDTFSLVVSSLTNSFQLTNIHIYPDAGGNGVPSSFTDITTTGPLIGGGVFHFVIVGTVPNGATGGQAGQVLITAQSGFAPGLTAMNTDTAKISNQAVINVNKTSSASAGSPGLTNLYTLTYSDLGNNTATNIYLTDAIPVGMTYVPGSGRWSVSGTTALTDMTGPGDPTGIDYSYDTVNNRVNATIASVAPGGTGFISFQIVINSNAMAQTINNTAFYTYGDGSGATITNQPSNTIGLNVNQQPAIRVDDNPPQAGDPAIDKVIEVLSAGQGTVVVFSNEVHNLSNGSDSYLITVSNGSFPVGTTFQIFQNDANTPLVNNTTGPINPGAYYTVVVKATLPASATGGPFTNVVTATSIASAAVSDSATDKLDIILKAGVDLTANIPLPGAPGAGQGPEVNPVITNFVVAAATTQFTLYVNNTNSIADTYGLSITNPLPTGWSVVFKNSSGTVITSTGVVSPGGNQLVYAAVTAPATNGTSSADLFFQALSPTTGAKDVLHDRAVISAIHAIAITPNGMSQVAPGSATIYVHQLCNQGNTNEAITLATTDSVTSPSWSSVLYLDNNGSGVFGSNDTVISAPILLAAGACTNFFVQVTAPAGAASSADTTTITGTTAGGTATAVATDKTGVHSVVPPTIDFYNSTFTHQQIVTALGAPLFVQANAMACVTNSAVVQTVVITLVSTLTGDSEDYTATETGPGTGVFQILPNVPTQDASLHPVVHGDHILQTLPNDTVVATLIGCSTGSVTTRILIDPNGLVFDSHSNQPVAGAKVTLIDVTGAANGGHPNKPATVFAVDGTTPAPATVTTTSDGRFSFPLAGASTYRLAVVAPSKYKFPSQVPVASLPPGHIIDASGSYGGSFVVSAAIGPVQIDVPVDSSSAPTSLFVDKTASVADAVIGDIVGYTVLVKNNTSNTLAAVTLMDDLPAGFAYMKKSAQLNGSVLPDPTNAPGPHLLFNIGSLTAGTTATVIYRVRIGTGATQGTGKNSAQAKASGPPALISNISVAKVRVTGGEFDDKSIIIGKIYVDKNHNHVQDDGEPGIPGVRLYMEDGTFVITDVEGKFSIYGLAAKTHLLKIDETTVPRGFKGEALTARHNKRGTLYLADLKKNELRKVDFADISDDPKVLAEVARRHAKGDPDVAQVEKLMAVPLTTIGQSQAPADVRAQPASGVITVGAPDSNTMSTASFTAVLPDHTVNSGNSNLPQEPVATVEQGDLEQSLYGVTTNTLGFVDLVDKDTLAVAQANIRVKGLLGSKFVLKVNGVAVSERAIGKRAKLADKQLEAWEFIGIDLKRGPNTLELTAVDGFGNARGTTSITVIAPGHLGHIKIKLPAGDQPADGVTPAKIQVYLIDDKGVPITARTAVTLETTRGRWDVKDLNPTEPGVQNFITGGHAEFVLLPPGDPGDAKITITSGVIRDEATLSFLPDLRPMTAEGVIETRVNFSRLNLSALSTARGDDGFDEQLRNWSFTADDGKVQVGARTALFLKGKIKGDYLLTLAYDSDKDSTTLFRDIQPDQYYPIYGDSSIRGFDAQSTSKLYVRIDKRKCYLLYGDYNSTSTSEARTLGNYSRSLTGVKDHYENSRVQANAWGSYDSSEQVVIEIPADGTSGPFFFRNANTVDNSEKVEILVRDRNQLAVVISDTIMTRFIDYEFDPFSGQLLFKAPIPSLDPNLNPISIRVTYETNAGGKKFLVAGADAQFKVNERLEIGGSYVHDSDPVNPYSLYSANATVKLAPKTYVIAEVAQSNSITNGTGDAARIELRHTSEATDLRVYAAHVATNFDNASANIAAGQEVMGAKLVQKISLQDRIIVEAVETRDVNDGGSLLGATASYGHTFDNKVALELGYRHSDETATPASTNTFGASPNHVNSLRAKVTTPVPFVPKASVYGEYENDIINTDVRAANIGGEYQLDTRTRVYVRHEFLDSLGSPFDLSSSQSDNRTVFGLETEYLPDAHLYNEYRVVDSASGAESEAAVGLHNGWQLGPGFRVNTTFERVTPITGGTNNTSEATAATLGADYTENPLYKLSGRVEFRFSDTSDHWLNTLGYAQKISQDWTALARTILDYNNQRVAGQGDLFQSRLQLGVAYRQTRTDVWNGLVKYEYKYVNDETDPSNPILRNVQLLTTEINFQPCSNLTFSARYVPEYVIDSSPTNHGSYFAQLVAGRMMYDVLPRLSVGLNGSVLFNGGGQGLQYGVGPEFGFRVHDNVWIDAGYNFLGFHDQDLSSENYTDHGFFIGMRMTFDEHIFDGLSHSPNKQ